MWWCVAIYKDLCLTTSRLRRSTQYVLQQPMGCPKLNFTSEVIHIRDGTGNRVELPKNCRKHLGFTIDSWVFPQCFSQTAPFSLHRDRFPCTLNPKTWSMLNLNPAQMFHKNVLITSFIFSDVVSSVQRRSMDAADDRF